MTKKISEVIIKVTGKGLKTVNADISKLQASIEETSAAAKGLHAALEEGGRSDAILNRIASSAERSEKEFQQLNKTSVNTLKLLSAQLEQTSYATEEAKAAAEGLGMAFKGTGRSTNGLNNRLKDTNRQGTNQVRTFSKLARSAGGLTIIYAAIAANVFALSEAFRLLNEASSVSRLSEVASVMSNEMGVSIKATATALQDATDNAVSYQEALKLAAASAAYGFDTKQMEELALVAKRASVVLGVDMQDALRRVTRGIAKQEVELLDELGLTVRLNEAFADYAAQHGIAANSLTVYQRQVALTNAVLAKSEAGLGAVDSALKSTEWEKFGASTSTAVNSLLQVISTSDIMTSFLKRTREGITELAADVRAFRLLSASPDARVNMIDSAGIEMYTAAYNVGANTLKGMAAAQVQLKADAEATSKRIEDLERSGNKYRAGSTQLSKEYRAQEVTLGIINEHLLLSSILTGNSVGKSEALTGELRAMATTGTTFSTEMAKARTAILGVAEVSLQGTIDDLKKSNAEIDRLSSSSTLPKIDGFSSSGISEKEVTGEAQLLANYQKLGIQLSTTQLGIYKETTGEVKLAAALAGADIALAESRLKILGELKATDKTILATTKEKLAAEEIIRGIEEAKLQRANAANNLRERHAVRNDNAVVKAEEELQIALRSQDMAKDSNATSAEYLRSLDNIVIAKGRALQIAKEQSKEEEKAAYFAIAGDLSSNIGSLNSGMGETAAGLTSMAQGWDDLGNKAKSSAEKIKAASQIAGGFQSALGGMINAASSMVASGIDAEIAAVKNSGMTQEQEEKKVRQLQKKKIKEQEKYTKASIILNTAMGVARSLGELPFPANFVIAGLTAAAGAMAYQQASNTAASQLASLGGGASAASNMEVTVGKASTPSADVSTAASSGERSQMLGDRGVYGRASAGTMKANTPYLTSESGRELVIPKADSKIVNATETENILSGRGGNTFAPVIQVSALDAQSLEERMPDILSMLQEQAEQQGFSLGG